MIYYTISKRFAVSNKQHITPANATILLMSPYHILNYSNHSTTYYNTYYITINHTTYHIAPRTKHVAHST